MKTTRLIIGLMAAGWPLLAPATDPNHMADGTSDTAIGSIFSNGPEGSPPGDGSTVIIQEQIIKEINGRYKTVVIHRMDAVPNATLVMEELHGDIILTGSDVLRIVIEEQIGVKSSREERAKSYFDRARGSLEISEADPPEYIFKVGDWISSDVSMDYRVRLPKMFNVIVATYGGDAEISKVMGDVSLKSGGGDMGISETAGKLVVKTGGGDINLFKVEGQILLQTGGGDIEGQDVNGKLKAGTGGGDIEIWQGKGSFELETSGGDISLRKVEGIEVDLRTGGGDISVFNSTGKLHSKTLGGEIEIEGNHGDVEVASSGGDLALREIIGDIIAYTSAGDVDIQGVTGAVQLRSNAGDITVRNMSMDQPGKEQSSISTTNGSVELELTGKLPFNLVARVRGVSLRRIDDYLDSDLTLTIRQDGDDIYGEYSREDAVHSISITTVNGEIRITSRGVK